MAVPEVKKMYGYIVKKEELKGVKFEERTDFLCLVASNPFPGYPHKVDKSYYYLLLDPGLKADEENLLRITQNINRSYDCNIDATPCELTLFNRIQLGLRLYNPEERTIPKIVGYYNRYGISFMEKRYVSQFISMIKVHKYFDLEESIPGIFRSITAQGFYYVKIPARLEWEEFNTLMKSARNEAGYSNCDFAMAVFRTNNSIEDYIRIFADDCTVDKQLSFREFILESVKSLTLK